jgi:pyrimidine operon attenuation protein/uracil phosphoribosyltransferase
MENQSKTIILNHNQILNKVKRIAFQIVENNQSGTNLCIGGIDTRGGFLAELIYQELENMGIKGVELFSISVNRNLEGTESVNISISEERTKNAHVIIVDDVLNTGKTLMNVLLKIGMFNPEQIETCFLVQRSHRKFPLRGDYVGISLATTFQEHVSFNMADKQNLEAFLA